MNKRGTDGAKMQKTIELFFCDIPCKYVLVIYLFILILSAETVSSDKTMQTASLRFFPLRSTESPRNNSNSSILDWDKATTELSSLAASSTKNANRTGLTFKSMV